MNGVYVDPQDLRKSCDDVNELAHFCLTGDGSDGDMAKPNKTDVNFKSELEGFELGGLIGKLNENWQRKCDDLGEDFGGYRDNLYYYSLSIQGVDDMNAHGLDNVDKPEWMDDVPNEQDNSGEVYHHG